MKRLIFTLCLCLLAKFSFSQPMPLVSTAGNHSPVAFGSNNLAISVENNQLDKKTIHLIETITLRGQGRKVFVSEVDLLPGIGFFSPIVTSPPNRDERADIRIKLRNITTNNILITAAQLEIIGNSKLRKRGGYFGERVLTPLISLNVPIQIESGKMAEITLSEGVVLDGIIKKIESQMDLDNAYIFDEKNGQPARLSSYEHVNEFNKILAELYGKNTSIKITLFQGDYIEVAKFNVSFSNGGNLFSYSETRNPSTRKVYYRPILRVDSFLAEYLKRKEMWFPSFKIKTPPKRCINAIPDESVPGRYRYEESVCQDDLGEMPAK